MSWINCTTDHLERFISSLALAADSSPTSSSAIAQSVPSKSTPTVSKCSCSAKPMDCSPGSPSGETSASLMVRPGADAWTSLPEDSPAPIFPLLARDSVFLAHSQAYGQSSPVCLGRYDPATHSLKIPQLSLLEDSPASLPTLPRWGWMHAGAVWGLTTSGRPISANASGFWPSPNAQSGLGYMSGSNRDTWRPTLESAVQMSPEGAPPQSTADAFRGKGRKAAMLPTPTANDTKNAGYQIMNGRIYPTLPGAAGAASIPADRLQGKGLFPTAATTPLVQGDLFTPIAPDTTSALTPPAAPIPTSAGSPDTLSTPLRWATPRANMSTGAGQSPAKQGGLNLQTQLGGSLNPTWVCWLMGWPLNWESRGPLNPQVFHAWRVTFRSALTD
jgi:hypothetical protein